MSTRVVIAAPATSKADETTSLDRDMLIASARTRSTDFSVRRDANNSPARLPPAKRSKASTGCSNTPFTCRLQKATRQHGGGGVDYRLQTRVSTTHLRDLPAREAQPYQRHSRGKIRKIGPVTLPSVNDEQAGVAACAKQVRARRDSRPQEGNVVTERLSESPRLKEVPLHVDDDEGGRGRRYTTRARLCFDAR